MQIFKSLTASVIALLLLGPFACTANPELQSRASQNKETNIVDAPQKLSFWITITPTDPQHFDENEFDQSFKWEAQASLPIEKTIEEKTAAEGIWSRDLGDRFEVALTLGRNGTMIETKQQSTSMCERFDAIVMDAIKTWIRSPEFHFPQHISKDSVAVTVSAEIYPVETCSGNSLRDFLDGKSDKYNGCAGMGWEARELMEARKPTRKRYFFVHH